MTEEPERYDVHLATRLSPMGVEERVTALESRLDSVAVTQRSILDGVDEAAAERAEIRNRLEVLAAAMVETPPGLGIEPSHCRDCEELWRLARAFTRSPLFDGSESLALRTYVREHP